MATAKKHKYSPHKIIIREAVDCIYNGFIWADTKQGEKYWVEVIKNLEGLIK